MAANVMKIARHTDMVMTADGKPTWWAKMAPGQNIVVSTLQDMESALTLSSLDWATLTESTYRLNGGIADLEGQLGSILSAPGGATVGEIMRAVNASFNEVPDHAFVVKGGTPGAAGVFATVSDGYLPHQNRELAKIGHMLIGETGASFVTAGSLMGGARVWFLLKLPENIKVQGDVIEKYLLVTSSHDASKSTQIIVTDIRVECWNTLTAALGAAKKMATLKHTTNSGFRLNEISKQVGLLKDEAAEHERFYNQLTELSVTPDKFSQFLDVLYGVKTDAKGTVADSTKSKNRKDSIRAIFANDGGCLLGADAAPMKGFNGYRALNTITQYQDHAATVRMTQGLMQTNATTAGDEARFRSNLLGSSAATKNQAVELLLEAIDVGVDATVKKHSKAVDEVMSAIDFTPAMA